MRCPRRPPTKPGPGWCGRPLVDNWRFLIVYGVFPIAGTQLGFFSAIQTLPVGANARLDLGHDLIGLRRFEVSDEYLGRPPKPGQFLGKHAGAQVS